METPRPVAVPALALAAAIELVTLAARFGLRLQSTRDTAWLARFTFGLRIHHGYIGALLVLAAHALPVSARARWIGLVLGWALVVSDAVHHLIVLWWFTGSPQFDLFYPR
jgi:hypothetical protein